MRYFLDTYALIEIAEGNSIYRPFIEGDTITLPDNLAELFYFFLRKYDEKTAHFFFNKFKRIVTDLPIEIIPDAMSFRYTHKKSNYSHIDCLGYIFSLSDDRIFLTGDRGFLGKKNAKIVRWANLFNLSIKDGMRILKSLFCFPL